MKDEKDFDDFIRHAALRHEAEVPADAWDNIMHKPKKRRGIFWWFVPASLLLAGFGYWYMQTTQSNTDVAIMGEKVKAALEDKTQKEMPETDDSTIYDNPNSEVINQQELAGIDQSKIIVEESRKNELNGGTKNKSINTKSSKKISRKSKSSNNIVSYSISLNREGANKKGSNSIIANNKKHQSIEPVISAELNDKDQALMQKGNEPQIHQSGNIGIAQAQVSANQLNNLKNGSNIAEDSNSTVNSGLADEKEVVASQKMEDNANAETTTTAKSLEIGNEVSASDNAKKLIQMPKPGRWFIDFSSGYQFSFSKVNKQIDLARITHVPNAVLNFTPETIKIQHEPGLSFMLGLRKMVSEKWGVGTGLQYQKMDERIRMTGTETQLSNVVVQRLMGSGSNGLLLADSFTINTSGIRVIDARNKYQLLSLPIYAHYRVLKRANSSMDVFGGAVINFAYKYQNNIDGVFKASGDSTNQKHSGLDFYTSIRYTRRLNNSWLFFIAPGFYLNITPSKLPTMITTSPFNRAGLNIGFSYQLKK